MKWLHFRLKTEQKRKKEVELEDLFLVEKGKTKEDNLGLKTGPIEEKLSYRTSPTTAKTKKKQGPKRAQYKRRRKKAARSFLFFSCFGKLSGVHRHGKQNDV